MLNKLSGKKKNCLTAEEILSDLGYIGGIDGWLALDENTMRVVREDGQYLQLTIKPNRGKKKKESPHMYVWTKMDKSGRCYNTGSGDICQPEDVRAVKSMLRAWSFRRDHGD